MNRPPNFSGGADPAEYGEHIAGVYDEWFAARDADIEPVVEFLAARAGGRPALELGIGTGRIALPLAGRGVPVAGIDSSPAMVERLRAKPGGSDLPVEIGDFAEADVAGGPFGLVYVVFNTFFALLTQDDQLRCFGNIAARLVPGGSFVMEAFVPDLTRFDHGQRVETVRLEPSATLLGASVHDRAGQRISSRHIAIGGDGIATYPVELRYAWPSELDLMAKLAGMRLAGRWGGWQGQPFTSASGAHVSVWEKPAGPGRPEVPGPAA